MPAFAHQNIYKKLGWFIILAGVLLRFYIVIFNPAPFIEDEAVIAHLVKTNSVADLIFFKKKFPSGGQYPLGFLLVTKVMESVFGYQEFFLRLFSFICGIVALILFARIKDWFLGKYSGLVAMLLFALNRQFILKGMVTKPYSSDVLIAILLLFMLKKLDQLKKIDYKHAAGYGLLGGLCILFSNPSIFILGAIALTLSLFSSFKADIQRQKKFLLMYALWVLFFGFVYFSRLYYYINRETLRASWGFGIDYTPAFLWLCTWACQQFVIMFRDPLGIDIIWGLPLFFCGSIYFYRQKKLFFHILILPLVLTLAAALLKQYAFLERIILFLIPSVIILISQGCETLLDLLGANRKKIISYTILTFVSLGLLSQPVRNLRQTLLEENRKMGFKPVIEYVSRDFKQGDIILVGFGVRAILGFYKERFPIAEEKYIYVKGNRVTKIIFNLAKVQKNRRFWYVYFNAHRLDNDQLVTQLNSFAERVKDFNEGWYGCSLFVVREVGEKKEL